MSKEMLSVMSEMVTKVCEQSREITQLREENLALKLQQAKKQEEVKALHDVWWMAYNCFPQSWADVTEHLIDDKGDIDIEAAKVLSEKLRNKDGLEEEATVDALVCLWDEISLKFPDKWDHIQHDLRNEARVVDIKTVEKVTKLVEKLDTLSLYCCH
jgi:hypothetical protein